MKVESKIKMSVAFLLPGRGYSGGVRAGSRLAEELLNRGHDVRLFYRKKGSVLKRSYKNLKQTFSVRPADWVSIFTGPVHGFSSLRAEDFEWADFIISVGPDCVAELTQMPTQAIKIFHVHGLTIRDEKMRAVAWGSPIYKIAVSDYVKSTLEQAGADRVVGTVGNGVDGDHYFPVSDIARTAIGTVYGPGQAKSPEKICEVFSLLRDGLNHCVEYICFGSCPRPDSLAEYVEYKRLPDVRQAREIYSRCAVWFCASNSEGFAMPLLEAMAAKCTVVTSDCGGCRDFVRDGFNGIVLKGNEPEQMTARIAEIYHDVPWRNFLSTNAISTAHEWSWAKAAQNMERILHQLPSYSKTTSQTESMVGSKA